MKQNAVTFMANVDELYRRLDPAGGTNLDPLVSLFVSRACPNKFENDFRQYYNNLDLREVYGYSSDDDPNESIVPNANLSARRPWFPMEYLDMQILPIADSSNYDAKMHMWACAGNFFSQVDTLSDIIIEGCHHDILPFLNAIARSPSIKSVAFTNYFRFDITDHFQAIATLPQLKKLVFHRCNIRNDWLKTLNTNISMQNVEVSFENCFIV